MNRKTRSIFEEVGEKPAPAAARVKQAVEV